MSGASDLRGSDSLLHRPGFMRLWLSMSLTQFGGEITFLALPLTASLLLQATPFQMSLLIACELLPNVMFALVSGVLVDRIPGRWLVCSADLLRALALLLIPAAALTGHLSLPLLYGVAFLLGLGGIIGWPAYQALILRQVGPDLAVAANGRISATDSLAQWVGPGIAGVLIHQVGAPVAMLADALAFMSSALLIRGLPGEPDKAGPAAIDRSSWIQDIREGVRLIWSVMPLRQAIVIVAIWVLLRHVHLALIVIYLSRELALDPWAIGALTSLGGVFSVVTAERMGRISGKWGIGSCLMLGLLLQVLSWILMALLGGLQMRAAVLSLLGLAYVAQGVSLPLIMVNYQSLRQLLAPPAALGRVIATAMFVTSLAAPLGAMAGGAAANDLHLPLVYGCIAVLGFVLLIAARSLAPQLLAWGKRPSNEGTLPLA